MENKEKRTDIEAHARRVLGGGNLAHFIRDGKDILCCNDICGDGFTMATACTETNAEIIVRCLNYFANNPKAAGKIDWTKQMG